MDKQEKNILLVLGIVIGILFIAKPKNSKFFGGTSNADKYSSPSIASSGDVSSLQKANESITAMRLAMNSGESKTTLTELSRMIEAENQIKLTLNAQNKLVARDLKGNYILTEK